MTDLPKPATRHELVMWLAFTGFYGSLAWLVCSILALAPFQVGAGALLCVLGTGWGAYHARSIHQDQRLPPLRSPGALPDQDLWEGRS